MSKAKFTPPASRYITKRVLRGWWDEVAVIDTESGIEVSRWGHPSDGLPIVKEDVLRLMCIFMKNASREDVLDRFSDLPEEVVTTWYDEAKALMDQGVPIASIQEADDDVDLFGIEDEYGELCS